MEEKSTLRKKFWNWLFPAEKDWSALGTVKFLVLFPVRFSVLMLLMKSPFILINEYSLLTRSSITHHDTFNESTSQLGRQAEQGDGEAMADLARLYAHGDGGLGEDNCAALLWNDRAARKNEPRAQNKLASAYFFGRGVPENGLLAYYWAKHALKNGADPEDVSYTIKNSKASLDREQIDRWNDFRPEDQPPVDIYNGPNLAGLERYLYFIARTCRE